MVRATGAYRRGRIVLFAALALLAGCGGAQRHNSAENEFNAWANGVEREGANGHRSADFEEPANIMDRGGPGNAQ
jgi:hypothetical protein